MPTLLYLNTAGIVQEFVLENLGEVAKVLGVGGTLIALALLIFYRVYQSQQQLQMLKQESAARVRQLEAETEAKLKLGEQQADAETTTRRDKMLAELISISAKSTDLQAEFIKTQNVTTELLRSGQTQSANILNILTTYRDTDESYQVKMAVAASQIQDNSLQTKLIVESLPAKLDGNQEKIMAELASIRSKIDEQYNNLIKQAEESRVALNASIMKIAVDVVATLPQPTPEVAASENVSEAPETKDGGENAPS